VQRRGVDQRGRRDLDQAIRSEREVLYQADPTRRNAKVRQSWKPRRAGPGYSLGEYRFASSKRRRGVQLAIHTASANTSTRCRDDSIVHSDSFPDRRTSADRSELWHVMSAVSGSCRRSTSGHASRGRGIR
jgi:hypothetical protein